METRGRLSRRDLAKLSIPGSAGLALTRDGALIRVARQGHASRWHAADGLRLAGSTTGPASLDPALSRDLSTNFLMRQIYRGLVSLDPMLQPALSLAEAVDTSTDGLTYTFRLRETARFQGGRAVAPEDVRFSLSRALDPRIAGGSAERLAGVTYLRDIVGAGDVLSGSSEFPTGIAITGDRSLAIALAEQSPTFLMKLAAAPASIVDEQQVRSNPEWWAAPNGSGPFAVSSWEPGSSLELVASETWWEGKAPVESIRVRLGPSATQPTNLFQAGEIDLVEEVPAEIVDLIVDPVSGVSYGELVGVELFATSFIALGNAVPPLDDVHVRKALQLVFPSDLIAEATFNGAVAVATGIVPPGMLGQQWPTRYPPHDVDAAREQIRLSRFEEAGQVPPIAIYAADIAAVESIRDVAAGELGLEIEAIHVPWPDFLNGLAERRFPAYSLYWGADYPDPESMIEMLFGSSSPDNYTGYRNAELDSLLDAARNSDDEERIEMLAQANQLLIDDAALIPLYHPTGYTLLREGLEGVEVTPMGIIGLESIQDAT